MAIVKAPLMSLDASGSIGGAIAFSKWKGRNYVRKVVKPANPNSPAQLSIRAMLRYTTQLWTTLNGGDQASWIDLAKSMEISPFNAYVGKNQARWRQFLPPSSMHPPTLATSPGAPTLTSATAGERNIALVLAAGATTDALVIFRDGTTGFTPSFLNAIAIVDGAAVSYTDFPLVPGDTWFYRLAALNLTGTLTGVATEVSATVLA
jgi:hypothetical protein